MSGPDPGCRLLVVAGSAAESDELLQALVARSGRQAVELTLIVPVSTEAVASPARREAGAEAARLQLRAALARFRAAGLYVREASVAEGDAVRTVADAAGDADEIVVATPPRRFWRRRSTLGERLHHATGLPVTLVVGRPARDRHTEPPPSRTTRRSRGPERRRGRPDRRRGRPAVRRAVAPSRPSQAWLRSHEPAPALGPAVRLNLARGLALLGFVLLALGVAGAT